MKVTYVGHATVLIELGGVNILTDPWFTGGPFVLRRKKLPGIEQEELPRIDLILLSHEHFDHLDKRSLQGMKKNCTVIAHAGLRKSIEKIGFTDIRGLKAWETIEVGSLNITAVPADHSRYSLGFIIENDHSVYFAGDTMLIPEDFKRIGETFSLDLAILPIGGVKIFGIIKKVMDEGDVIKALKLLRPAGVLPIHWGTFKERSLLMTMPGMPELLESLMKRNNSSCKLIQLPEGSSTEL